MQDPPPLPLQAPKSSGWKTLLIVIGVCVGLFVIIIGLGILYAFSGRDFDPTASQKESILTIDYAANFIGIDPSEGVEEWDCKKFIDGSIQIFYLYTDEYTSLDCTVTVERTTSDAVTSYAAEWGALKLGNRLSEADVGLEEANHVFSGGDDSQFAFQVSENERYGFAFITRKDKKIYFVDAWGITLEDPDVIAAFLTPKLELFAAESYRK